jgi:Ser/Thr protein kinase RdoA (MazF antagonist)
MYFVHANTAQRQPAQPTNLPGEVCNNDFAPYNCLFCGGRPTAMIDFDKVAPGTESGM